MGFLQKARAALQKFMTGRRGADEFSLMLLIVGVVLSILSGFSGLWVLSLLGYAAYIYALYRMFSRNIEKRYQENVKFLATQRKVVTEARQTFMRLKNIRKYKYFKCPECHSLLRLPRKAGEVTITCGKCHHAFKQKA